MNDMLFGATMLFAGLCVVCSFMLVPLKKENKSTGAQSETVITVTNSQPGGGAGSGEPKGDVIYIPSK